MYKRQISGRGHRIRLLEKLLEHVCADSTAWVTTVGEVALHHTLSVNKDRFTVALQTPELIGARRFAREV